VETSFKYKIIWRIYEGKGLKHSPKKILTLETLQSPHFLLNLNCTYIKLLKVQTFFHISMIFLRRFLYTLVTSFLSRKWNHNIALFLSLQRLPKWLPEVVCKSWFTLLLLQSNNDHLGSDDGKGQCTTMWPGVQYFLHGIRHLTVFKGLITSHSIVCVAVTKCKWVPVHLCYTELFGTAITWFLYDVELCSKQDVIPWMCLKCIFLAWVSQYIINEHTLLFKIMQYHKNCKELSSVFWKQFKVNTSFRTRSKKSHIESKIYY
jgi:hypothetical protein